MIGIFSRPLPDYSSNVIKI